MNGSDSRTALTTKRFGRPSRSIAPLARVPFGPLLFRAQPWSLDMRHCPRKVRVAKAFDHAMLPANSGEALGTFNDINFGVYPHTSCSFLSTLRTRHY